MAGMRGRSHRHRVPTARPPAQALGVVYVWGRGAVGSPLRRYLRETDAALAEHDDVARAIAMERGCPLDMVPDAWAWRIDGGDPGVIDDLTRGDRAVMGWTQHTQESCESSLALKNALNAMRSDERAVHSHELESRFGASGRAHVNGDPNRWLARDNRIVYFDDTREEWRLGDYEVSQTR